MGNIANPLTGTKIDGSTFTAAEANAAGQSFTRCLVNDGQSDLVATSSVNGGGNKGFSVFGCTNLSLSCSLTMTQTCATHTIAGSGAATRTCTTYGLTASGAVALSCAAYALNCTGDVALNADGDLTLQTDQDLILNPTGVASIAASKLSLTGTGWVPLGARTAAAWAVPYNTEAGPGWTHTSATGRYEQAASAATLEFDLHVPEGYVVNSVTVRLRSIGQPSGTFPPATMPSMVLVAVNVETGATTTLAGPTVDASASAAAFAAYHSLTCTPGSPYTVPANTKLALVVFGTLDASNTDWVQVLPPRASVTISSLRLA